MKAIYLASATLAVAVACTHNGPRTCEPVPVEFFKMGGPVYRDCAVDRKVTAPALGRAAPGFTPRQPCGHVTIMVVIDTTGFPIRETAKVTHSNDSALEQVMLAGLTDQRYGPALKNGVRVRQLYAVDQKYIVAVVVGGSPSSTARSQAPRTC